MSRSSHIFWVVCVILFSINVGFFLGQKVRQRQPQLKLLRSEQNKINEALELININYVDTVDLKYLAERAVHKIISELDPHSTYIPASDVETVNEDLDFSFGGIGITFNFDTDTIIVISIISPGPAEKAGILPFDRIMTVDDSIVAGKNIGTNKMLRMLRGPKNSKVVLGVQRGNAEELLQFELVRGDIPNYTVDVSYKVVDDIGYIKISKFARSTYKELIEAIAKLKEEGVKGFIIDLRYNPGGLMEYATYMVNEFLPKGNLIVYTQGKAYPRSEARANGKGVCQDAPLIVLINEQSGSASEIFAGAIQDNDRGLIIGRRSYGKGLVQAKLELSDKSELLLTIARYYTPSGRSIQKEYQLGKSEEYGMDLQNRFQHGEFFNVDSIKMSDSTIYQTIGGRPVYGGGGIMPDIFIPQDTIGHTSYFLLLRNSNVLYQFTLDYSTKNQELLKKFSDYKALHAYLKQLPLAEELAEYAVAKGINKRPALLEISRQLIETHIHAFIIRNFFNNDGFFPVYYQDDPTLLKAVEVIQKNIWNPSIFKNHADLENEIKTISSTYIPLNRKWLLINS